MKISHKLKITILTIYLERLENIIIDIDVKMNETKDTI